MVRRIWRFGGMVFLLAGFLSLPAAEASAKTFTFRVRHLHRLGSCRGQLTIQENHVRYDTDRRGHARIWTYQQLKRAENASPRRLTFVTYESSNLPIGRDRKFKFKLLGGAVNDELFEFLLTRVGRRAAPKPPDVPPGGRYELAVKHHHFIGGCHGVLRVTPAFMEYVTSKSGHARMWKYIDLKRIQPRGAYRLRLHTYEDQRFLFGADRVFNFELKEPLEPDVLGFMKKRIDR